MIFKVAKFQINIELSSFGAFASFPVYFTETRRYSQLDG